MANPSSRPVTPQSTAAVTTTSSPSSAFKKGNKRDMSLYPDLKDITHYSSWKLAFDALAHKDELGNVLDEGYKPSKADEDVFNLQKQWLFAVFTKTLKDPTAKDILRQYQHNGDSQQIYAKLKSKARKSAKATLAKMRLVEFLTTGNLIIPGKVPIMDSFYIGVLSCVSLKKLLLQMNITNLLRSVTSFVELLTQFHT